MSTADRSQTWRCGKYRVELAAPRLWVVSREIAKRSGEPKVALEATTGSRKTARGLVTKLHHKHCAERSLLFQLAMLAAAVVAAVGITSVEPSLTVPAVMATTLLASRTLLSAIDLYLARSWDQISQTYQ